MEQRNHAAITGTLVLGFTLGLLAVVHAQAPEMMMKTTDQAGRAMATIPGTHVRTIASRSTGENYDLYILLPSDYEKTTATYPVFYHPDAFYTFGAIADLARNLQNGGDIRKFILVGISEGVGWDSPKTHRFRDFSSVAVPGRVPEAGAANYLKFLREELFPFIEKEYRADPAQRIFHGASAGGNFGAYVLFEAPATFHDYILSSPAFGITAESAMADEEKFAGGHQALPARVVMTMGGDEGDGMIGPMQRLAEKLRSRKYEGLQLDVMVTDGQVHSTSTMVAMPTVLRKLYPVAKPTTR